MRLEAFLAYVRRGEVPPEPPDGLSPGGWDMPPDYGIKYYEARDECTARGMWCVVDLGWTALLAEWIGDHKVLEVMSGPGWLAKALALHGADVVATDELSDAWEEKHAKAPDGLFPVRRLEASAAVRELGPGRDVLLVSWSPYGDEAVTAAARLWGPGRPIVYVGETDGGCGAPESFWEGFRALDGAPEFPMVSWYGIHDEVVIGFWKGE
jgi:hypothetical protein